MFQWLILCLYRLCFCFMIASIGINGDSVGWSSWSYCSVTCGQGKQTRSKICLLGAGLCIPSSLVGTEEKDCNSGPCPTNSSLIASNSPSPTQNPTFTTSPTYSPTSSITPSKPTIVIGNSFFTLSHRGCRYSSVRISQTVKVRNIFHCMSICARVSDCVAFNFDSIGPSDGSRMNEYLRCEIIKKDYGSDVDLSQVSDYCKNYEQIGI